jgi:hypothetical protein
MLIQRNGSRAVNAETEVDPGATELLFETDDVAQLLAEVTGQDVEVTSDETGEGATFSVGEEDFTIEPEGTEEMVESSTKLLRGRKPVAAATNRRPAGARRTAPAKKPVSAATKTVRTFSPTTKK